ncbi:MAG: phosphoglycolate phosphatase, partial [Gammaproteobacteria bacterium]|nr:phosphoglycolate phosphatase [Gammaproteobacteria bacterium]
MPLFTDIYGRNVCERSRVFDGVAAGLDFLEGTGAHLGCVTNKSDRFTRAL